MAEAREAAGFRTTRWSLIVAAGGRGTPQSRLALSQLCEMYWYPLYVFARRRNGNPDSAADLIQGFFAELLEGQMLGSADPAKGRFRSYLLGALKHYMSGQAERARAKKRGGGRAPISLANAETRYGLETSHNLTPERLYDHRWALTVLSHVFNVMRDECASTGKIEQFQCLKDFIAGPIPGRSYADAAADLGTSEGAIKVAVHRMRKRYRQILAEQIAQTVESPAEIEDEIRHLHAAVAGAR